MIRAGTRIVVALAALCAAGGAQAAEPFLDFVPAAPPEIPVPQPQMKELPSQVPSFAVAEIEGLLDIGNDNDGKPGRMAVRTDASGKAQSLEYGGVAAGSRMRVIPIDDAIRRCDASGSDRINTDYACGVELEHARGNTSAVRIVAPNLDASAGGELKIIYLKHYAIFGSHEVGEADFTIKRTGGSWGLYLPGGAARRVLGFFLHRLNRGISLTACVGAACPAEWTTRGRDQNDGLPAVWESPAALKAEGYASAN